MKSQPKKLAPKVATETKAIKAREILASAVAKSEAPQPSKSKVVFSPRQIMAFRAHRTMVVKQMKGASKTVRATLTKRIAHYDALISQTA